ncbi:hypothetical protein [Pseudosulfitobacter pseudonitzschiae]|uniref:hypothetical protein n=1 Tax=Pseudosulfitobacter pseudonitzschiae TaxID=1402135 RepID=UPI003B7C1821
MKYILTTVLLALSLAGPALPADRDISDMADRIGRDIDRLNKRMIERARDYEDKNGPVTLPGGTTLSVDDLVNADPVGLANRLGSEYGNAIMGQFTSNVELPDFNPEQLCREEAIAADTGPSGYNACINAEQHAYDAWKAAWADLDAPVRAYCAEFATFHGGSYARLAECIEATRAGDEGLTTFER